jgi:hypothetical protein
MAASIAAISGRNSFRKVLKAAKFAFKSDMFAYNAAREQLRTEYFKSKEVQDPHELKVKCILECVAVMSGI